MWARVVIALIVTICVATAAHAQQPPELTQPVHDFANVIDAESEQAMDSLVRSLQQASGDVVVVATIESFAPYGELREYAVEMFENRGRGIGQRGRDNGLLIVLAVNERRVWIEVGYDLEQFITDGFAGETSRQYMIPEFRRGAYGEGLLVGLRRVIGRIADGRDVTLDGVTAVPRRAPGSGSGGGLTVGLFVIFILINAIAGMLRGRRRSRRRWWGGGPWSGWHSGVGPFGGGGFRGGGGFGGGFGGFGGGRSGGGGGGGGW